MFTDGPYAQRLERLLDYCCNRNRDRTQRADVQMICPTGQALRFEQHNGRDEPRDYQGKLPDWMDDGLHITSKMENSKQIRTGSK
jgi:hypothetical protein